MNDFLKGKNLIIGLGVITLIGLVLAYYFGSRTGKALTSPSNESANAAVDVNPQKLTYELSTYNSMASKLYEALSGIFTDEEAVYSVMVNMKNLDDVLQLKKSFGKRGFFDIDAISGTLSEWLYQSMSSGEIRQINDILVRNCINYKF